MKNTLIDPYLLFSGLNFMVKGNEVYLSCPCPIHISRDSYNAKFNMATGEYISFGLCKKTFNRYQTYELLKWLKVECGIEGRIYRVDGKLIKRTEEKEEIDWREFLKLPLAYDNEYLISRGVTNDIVNDMQIRANEEMVVFPNTDISGAVVGVNTRFFGKKRKIRYIYRGERTPLFRMSDIMKYDCEKPLIVTEGVFGMIRGKSFGYQTSALLGTGGLSDISILSRFDKVVFGLDRDEAGLQMAMKIIDKKVRVWFSQPEEYDELDKDGWERVLSNQTVLISNYKKWFSGENNDDNKK